VGVAVVVDGSAAARLVLVGAGSLGAVFQRPLAPALRTRKRLLVAALRKVPGSRRQQVDVGVEVVVVTGRAERRQSLGGFLAGQGPGGRQAAADTHLPTGQPPRSASAAGSRLQPPPPGRSRHPPSVGRLAALQCHRPSLLRFLRLLARQLARPVQARARGSLPRRLLALGGLP
jgi:hypothetical protein